MGINWDRENMRQVIRTRGSECVYNDVSTKWRLGRSQIVKANKNKEKDRGKSHREKQLAEATKRKRIELSFLNALDVWGRKSQNCSFLSAVKALNSICSHDSYENSIEAVFRQVTVESILNGDCKFGVVSDLTREKMGHDAIVAITEIVKVFGYEFATNDASIVMGKISRFFKSL